MSNFKTYKDLEEFYKNTFPIQTRIVIVEKYSRAIQDRKFLAYDIKIMNLPHKSPTEKERQIILKEKQKKLSKLLKKEITGFIVTNYEKNKPISDDYTSIYELF